MKRFIKLAAGVSVAALIPTAGHTSGFDNLPIGSMDMLFDPAKASIEFGMVYIDKNVDYKSENASLETAGPGLSVVVPTTDGATKARATPNAWNYSVNAKVSVTDNVDCLGQLNNPGTIEETLPDDWNGRYSIIETELQSMGLSATCSYKIEVVPGGYFRLIGGARYIEAEIYNKKISGLGEATVTLEGEGFGWRAGAAFEYPEYAIRASLFYDSAIDLEMKGNLKSLSPVNPSKADVTMPQGVEFRVQSGIAPKWLMFAGVKWVDWSVLEDLTVNAVVLSTGKAIAKRTFGFEDGWTVTAGIGHQLTEKIQVGSSLTWDKGIGTSYSDTYSLGLGGSVALTDKVKWSLGGVVAYKLGAEDRYPDGSTIIDLGRPFEYTDRMDLSYDDSWNFGVGTKLKIDF